ncbi:prepilin-type N-terminal cleavage/methylation domain-containing protein [Vreelandella sp. 21]
MRGFSLIELMVYTPL